MKPEERSQVIAMILMGIYILILVLSKSKDLNEGQMMAITFILIVNGFLNFIASHYLTRWVILTLLITLIILI